MKYLKIFEDNKNWWTISIDEYNNKLWGDEDIDDIELLKFMSNTREIFTDKEISYLDKKIGVKSSTQKSPELVNIGKVGSELKFEDIPISGNFNRKIIVYKLKDEWFYILRSDYPKHNYYKLYNYMYKCDQFDGLIDCLNSFK